MSGTSIASLIFVCFLAFYSCKSDTPKSEPPKSEPITSEPPKGKPDTKYKPDTKDKPGGLQTSQRGNCLYKRGTIGGSFVEKCEYSINNVSALCPTDVAECKSNPPSGNCSTADPVAVAPSPCP